MPKFAVYFIPNGPFYHKGTTFLGYDIRKKKQISSLKEGIDPSWVDQAQSYGFHLTIGDTIDFDPEQLPRITRELEKLVSCFDPATPFELTAHPQEFITRFGNKEEVVVLRYHPNTQLLLFHALVVARINPMGKGSGYLGRLWEEEKAKQDYSDQRIQQFYSPYILDDYTPHFTLLNPYNGNDFASLKAHLLDAFTPFRRLTVHSVCLVVRYEQKPGWEIYHEVRR